MEFGVAVNQWNELYFVVRDDDWGGEPRRWKMRLAKQGGATGNFKSMTLTLTEVKK